METILKDLGCNQKETQVYLALAKLGVSNASQVAREVGIPRQTVYYAMESLIEKELVEQTDQKGVRQFRADIFKIKSVIDKKKHQLELNKRKLDDEIIRLSLENYSGQELPKVQFYQGREGLKRLLSGINELYRKGKYKIFRGYAISKYYPGMEDFIANFVEERDKLGIQSKLFVSESTNFEDIGGQDKLGRKFKKLDIGDHEAAFYVVGNRVYLFSYRDGVGVMVENDNIARFMAEIFDERWNK